MRLQRYILYVAGSVIISMLSLLDINYGFFLGTTSNSPNDITSVLANLVHSVHYINFPFVLLTVCIYTLLLHTDWLHIHTRDYVLTLFSSFIMSFYLYLGKTIRYFGSLEDITSNLLWIKLIIKSVFTSLIISLVIFNCEQKLKNYLVESKSVHLNNRGALLKSFLIVIVCWLPYYVILFPGTGNPDTHNQLLEFFGMGKIARSIYPTGHYLLASHPFSITNQHDFLMTVFLGVCVKAGIVLLGKISLGFALASLLQMLFCAFALSYSINILEPYQRNPKLTKFVFWTYCLLPIFPIYSLYLVKNSFYSVFLILFVTLLMQFNLDHSVINKLEWQILLVVSCAGQLVSEKYAIDILLIVLFFALIIYRSYIKQWILLLLLPMLIIQLSLMCIFRVFNVPPSDPIEAYSVPIQQTALTVKKYPHDLSSTEYNQLNKMFVVKNLGRLYNPILADPVKSAGGVNSQQQMGYRFKTVETSDVQNYKKIWFKMFLKRPKTYLLAFLNLNYGYFDMNSVQVPTNVESSSNSLPLTFVTQIVSVSGSKHVLKQNSFFLPLRKVLSHLYNLLVGVPPFSLFLNGSIYIWTVILLLLLCVFISGWHYIFAFVPVIMQLPVLLLSPANNSQRYIYPVIFTTFLFAIFIDCVAKKIFHTIKYKK